MCAFGINPCNLLYEYTSCITDQNTNFEVPESKSNEGKQFVQFVFPPIPPHFCKPVHFIACCVCCKSANVCYQQFIYTLRWCMQQTQTDAQTNMALVPSCLHLHVLCICYMIIIICIGAVREPHCSRPKSIHTQPHTHTLTEIATIILRKLIPQC